MVCGAYGPGTASTFLAHNSDAILTNMATENERILYQMAAKLGRAVLSLESAVIQLRANVKMSEEATKRLDGDLDDLTARMNEFLELADKFD
jgi:hypothetical protein